MGAFEKATGLDESIDTVYQYFHRRSVWTLYAFARALGRPPVQVFVAVGQGRVLGTASLALLPKAGYVFAVGTDSAYRGRGIASRLLEQAHRATRDRGIRWTALDVESDNETAIRVYRRLGYEQTARFNWYVGPTPHRTTQTAVAATEVPESRMKEVVAWVNLHQLPALLDPLPATNRMLSHLENVTQLPGAPKARTWLLASSGQPAAVARGTYLPTVHTGFVLPVGWDPAISVDSLLSLASPVIDWSRSLGAARTVVAIPGSPGAWEHVVASLGLSYAVSTTLMVRPSAH